MSAENNFDWFWHISRCHWPLTG